MKKSYTCRIGMHRAELQMDMDSQWDTSQTSESPLWISSWCGKASSELSDGKVQVTRRPTTTARGDFFCITDDVCLATLGVVIVMQALEQTMHQRMNHSWTSWNSRKMLEDGLFEQHWSGYNIHFVSSWYENSIPPATCQDICAWWTWTHVKFILVR